ncbi:MAG: hypothetical protein MUO89_05170 [Dehalococcoidia bacterium]|nr:hypothetical protein [Dehalococcoidia bacterium]
MTSHVGKICLVLLVASIMLCSACLATTETKDNKLGISKLEAEYTNVYPKGWSEIKYLASGPGSENLQYTWSSDGGTITGEGSTVDWQAPNEYGDYHVMVTAKDNNGGKAEAVLTLSVIPRPYRSCCGGR